MIAIIETGGKQYLVSPQSIVTTEKFSVEAGKSITFDNALLLAEPDGTTVKIGTPHVSANILATVESQIRDKKINVIKFKSKVRYRRKAGHRQHHTRIKITSIQ